MVSVEKGLDVFQEYVKDMYHNGPGKNQDQLVLCSTANWLPMSLGNLHKKMTDFLQKAFTGCCDLMTLLNETMMNANQTTCPAFFYLNWPLTLIMKTLQIELDKKEHPIKNLEKIFINQELDFSEVLGKKMIHMSDLHEKYYIQTSSKNTIRFEIESSDSKKIRSEETVFLKVHGDFPVAFEDEVFLLPARNKNNNGLIPIKLGKMEKTMENPEKFYLHCVARPENGRNQITIQSDEILAHFSTVHPSLYDIQAMLPMVRCLDSSKGIYAQKQGKIQTFLNQEKKNTSNEVIQIDNSEDILDPSYNLYFLSLQTVSVKYKILKTAQEDEVITQASLCLYDIDAEKIVFEKSHAIPSMKVDEKEVTNEHIHGEICKNIIDPLNEYLVNNNAAVIAFQPREVMNCLLKLAKANGADRLLLINLNLISDFRWIFNSKSDVLRDKSWQKQVSNILYGGKKEVQQSQVYHLGDVCKLSSQALKKLFKKAGGSGTYLTDLFESNHFNIVEVQLLCMTGNPPLSLPDLPQTSCAYARILLHMHKKY